MPKAGQGHEHHPRPQSRSMGKAPSQGEHLNFLCSPILHPRAVSEPLCTPEWYLTISVPPVSHLFLFYHLLWLMWRERETRGGTVSVNVR